MNIRQALKMAVKSIRSNVVRSLLTMLGVIIGLAAVIILVSYSQGKNLATKALYESQGSNILQVSAYSWNSDVGQQLYDYCQGLDEVLGVTPNAQVWSNNMTITYGAKTLAQDNGGGMYFMGGGVYVEGGGGGGQQEDHYPTIYLGNDQFGLCNNYQLAKGRDFSYLEIKNMSQVCILGSDTAEYLFSFEDPIDKTININGRPFRVIGVYESKAAKAVIGKANEDDPYDDTQWIKESLKRQDKLILLPSTMTRYFNNNQSIDQYYVKARSSGDMKKVVTSLNGFLSGIINQNTGYYDVYNPGEYQQNEQKKEDMDNAFIAGIAAISLLVGGIGIMNIMLVTVTERTREIGIRKAIGAERRSIIIQFLIEAAMICSIGGLFGIGFGYVITMVLTKAQFGVVIMPSGGITAAAFGISVVLGIIFGLWPAIKASRLQPVEALRAD